MLRGHGTGTSGVGSKKLIFYSDAMIYQTGPYRLAVVLTGWRSLKRQTRHELFGKSQGTISRMSR